MKRIDPLLSGVYTTGPRLCRIVGTAAILQPDISRTLSSRFSFPPPSRSMFNVRILRRSSVYARDQTYDFYGR